MPDRHDEYRFYQLLIGLWPADAQTPPASLADRLVATMIKSAREARRHTSWVRPNSAYEDGMMRFVREALAIGDGANDLAMIKAAGLGIAYRAKPIVSAEAHARIDHTSLATALFFQGYRRSEFTA